MNGTWDGQTLVRPIAADKPCGENLEDTLLLASFDAFRVFGRPTPLDPAPDSTKPKDRALEKPDPAPDWTKVKDRSLEALERSKDLRLLAHLAAALLRTDGLAAFSTALTTAAEWLETYWDETYPPADGDAILRRNALNCLGDRMAVVDELRRVPLTNSREHGRFSLRDIDILAGLPPTDDRRHRHLKQINAAFASMPLEGVQALERSVAAALGALRRIEEQMREKAGPEGAPAFEGLLAQLVSMQRVLSERIAARSNATPGVNTPPSVEPARTAAPAASASREPLSGPMMSREDAARALEAVAEFFRRHEPSSPVPLLVERAKRLVSKDFLEVLADIAPDAVAQARAAGGLRRE